MESPRLELEDKIMGLMTRHSSALIALIVPARAAANAMTDAGMVNTAAPLVIVLDQLDVVDRELRELMASADPREAVEVFLNIARKAKE